MKLIARQLAPSAKYDELAFVRCDMPRAAIPMPRQGILPHDLVHYVVESRVPLRGFLGAVAEGAAPGFVMQQAEAPVVERGVEQLVQVEAVVEALQSQLWAGELDIDAFADGLAGACACRGIDPPDVFAVLARALFDDAIALDARWRQVGFHHELELDFQPRWQASSAAPD